MPLRAATYADLLPASKILSAAFFNEDFFGQTVHPHRHEYPDDMYLFFLRNLREDYLGGPNEHLIVTYKADVSGKEECITGFAHWQRKRKSKGVPLTAKAAVKVVQAYNYAESLIWPNRAANPSKVDVLPRSAPFVDHHWTGSRADSWYLSLIGVDPKAEKQGYGRALVEWGFDRAREEGVGTSVVSAGGREKFYRSCGFNVEDGTVHDEGGEANPLHDVPGGAIFFWDGGKAPEGVKKYQER